jgi:hypothetical protein
LNLTGSVPILSGDRINRIKRTTAQTFATYTVSGASGSGDDCRGEDTGSDDHDECEGKPDTYLDAVTVNHYGNGQALFAGFDLLAEATQDGTASLAAQVLLAALDLTQPPVTPQLGAVVPIQLKLKNQGAATSATAAITLPLSATLENAGGGTVVSDAQTQVVMWSVNLGLNEERELAIYVKLPIAAGTLTLSATVTAGTDAKVVAQTTASIDIAAVSSLNELYDQATALGASGKSYASAANKAAKDLGKATKESRLDKAVPYALAATDELLGITDPDITALRTNIDRWLRYSLMLM